ncbi:hypothetical protein ACU4GD_37630, partial [Cupriavidus basilensis]
DRTVHPAPYQGRADVRARTAEPTRPASLASVFNRKYGRSLVLSSVLVIGLQAGCYAILVWLPSTAQPAGSRRHIDDRHCLHAWPSARFCGFAVAGLRSTRSNRAAPRALILLSICAWVVTVSYMLLPLNTTLTAILGFVVGFSAIGMFAALGPFLSELFPTQCAHNVHGLRLQRGQVGRRWLRRRRRRAVRPYRPGQCHGRILPRGLCLRSVRHTAACPKHAASPSSTSAKRTITIK